MDPVNDFLVNYLDAIDERLLEYLDMTRRSRGGLRGYSIYAQRGLGERGRPLRVV